jgi:hypothetical protein
MFHRSLLAVPALVVLSLATSAQAQSDRHRELRAALYEMKQAKEDLKNERFKRHREKAEKELDVAITELERALKWARVETRYEPPRGHYDRFRDFRHLRQAMVDLEAAKREVRDEKGDWGGRRKELERAVDDAHARVKEALEDIK